MANKVEIREFDFFNRYDSEHCISKVNDDIILYSIALIYSDLNYKYSFKNNTIKILPHLSSMRINFSTVFNEKYDIMIVGGDIFGSNNNGSSIIEILEDSKWMYLKNMKDNHTLCSTICINDKLFVFSGLNAKTNEMYSFTENKWSSIEEFKRNRYEIGLSYFKNYDSIILISGCEEQYSNNFCMFNMSKNKFIEYPDLFGVYLNRPIILVENNQLINVIINNNLIYCLNCNCCDDGCIRSYKNNVIQVFDLRSNKWCNKMKEYIPPMKEICPCKISYNILSCM